MQIKYIEEWSDIHKLRGWVLIPAGCQIDLGHNFVLSTFQRRFFPPLLLESIQSEVAYILQLTGLTRYGVIDFPQFRMGLFQIAYDYNLEVSLNLARFSVAVLKEWLLFRNIPEVGIIVPTELVWLFNNLLDVLPDNVSLIMLNSSREEVELWNTTGMRIESPERKSLFGSRSLLSFLGSFSSSH